MLEGFCNSGKLINDEDKLELRYMDELFMIEKQVGEVQAIIGLQFNSEKEYIDEDEVEKIVFEEEIVQVAKAQFDGEEGEEPVEQAPVDDDEAKAPVFDVKANEWTNTDRKSKNMP